MVSKQTPPLLHGIVLVVGGAVGGGMFALPVVSAGAGFGWAILGMSLVWMLTYLASLVLLEVNLSFPVGASFNTLVRTRLGDRWVMFNNLAIVFIMMILMYAYISAGASIIEQSVSGVLSKSELPSRGMLSLMFAFVVGFIVWAGTGWVSRLSGILLIAMLIAFVLVNTGLALQIELKRLASATTQLGHIWAALPVFVTAFACGGLVPSLVKHYQGDVQKVRRSLFYGTLLVLLIYGVWLSTTLGVLSMKTMTGIIVAGGNTGDLVAGLQEMNTKHHATVGVALGVFSHFAIITSFLSIGLGLFHFIADRFAWSDDVFGKAKTVLLTFAPPAIMSFFFPKGFVSAIGYAGLVVVFSFFVVPILMLFKQRRMLSTQARLNGRNIKVVAPASRAVLLLILVFALMIAVFKVLAILELLPGTHSHTV